MSKVIYIGIDPGVTGGISILDGKKVYVYPIPVMSIPVVRKKKKASKKIYNLVELASILMSYFGKKVFFAQEKVASRPGEGSVSSFGFGKSSGSTLGMAYGLGFEVVEVNPVTWKKHFPQLETVEIQELREEIKALKETAKSIKGTGAESENKKQQEKIIRKIKSLSKEAARQLASLKCPPVAHKFCKVNTDGMAESLLIALYARENYGKLVQGNSKKT